MNPAPYRPAASVAGFVRACELDVAVRKPGNVSRASAGHGMHADLFIASARAAAVGLFERGARVGARIEAATGATWAVAGCNTNLGIVLLCAPIARAIELEPEAVAAASRCASIDRVLAGLDIDDARAAYRAIARASPGGLGDAPAEDVRGAPSVDLRSAMGLAASRDHIARLYRDGYAELFTLGDAALGPDFRLLASRRTRQGDPASGTALDTALDTAPSTADAAAVQRLYLALLARQHDSHIVRLHGEAAAQSVMDAAQRWQRIADGLRGTATSLDPIDGFVAWDAELKARRINPGTTADLTVAALWLAGATRDA